MADEYVSMYEWGAESVQTAQLNAAYERGVAAGRRQAADEWRATYEAKVAEFAAETLRTSTLVNALHEAGHRAQDFVKNRYCGRCIALREVGAADPGPARAPAEPVEEDTE